MAGDLNGGSLGSGTTVTLQSDVETTAPLTLAVGSAIALNGHGLTLSGPATLSGALQGPGTARLAGRSRAAGLVIRAGAAVTVAGSIVQDGAIDLNDGTLGIDSGGVWTLLTESGLAGHGAAAIVNAGLIDKTGIAGTSTIDAGLTSSGTLRVDAGTLEVTDGTLGGLLAGAGEIAAGAGAVTLMPGLTAEIGTLAVLEPGGQLVLAPGFAQPLAVAGLGVAAAATLDLQSQGLTAAAAALRGLVRSGTLDVAAAALNGATLSGALVQIGGTAEQDGTVALGTDAALGIAAGASYRLLTDTGIGGPGVIHNDGVLAKTGRGGTSFLDAGLVSTGTLEVAHGTLALAGSGLLGGTIAGAGVLEVRGGGAVTLADGVVLSLATLALSGGTLASSGPLEFGGSFVAGPGASLVLGGTLALDGPAQVQGSIDGGVLESHGAAAFGDLALTGATLVDAGIMAQSGALRLADATLSIASGARYDLLDRAISAQGTSRLQNAGTLVSAYGGAVIAAPLASSGSLVVAAGTLALLGTGNTLDGTIAGGGTLDLRAGGSSVLTAAPGLAALRVLDAGTTLALGADLAAPGRFALGAGATLNLAGHSLALADATLDGAVVGEGGTLALGAGTLHAPSLAGGAVLEAAGAVVQFGTMRLDGTLRVDPGASYLLQGAAALAGSGSASNAGTLRKAGAGAAVLAALSNAGTLDVAGGSLSVTSLANDGLVQVTGAALDAAVSGTGRILIDAGGCVALAGSAAGQSVGFLAAGGTLALAAGAVPLTIDGFGAGDTIDLAAAANGFAYADGTLTLTLTSGATTTPVARLAVAVADPAALALIADGAGGTDIVLDHAPGFVRPASPPGMAVWTGTDGAWNDPGNWRGGAVPGAGDAVTIDAGQIDGPAQARVTALSGSATLAAGGSLALLAGGTWAGAVAQSAGELDLVSGWSLDRLAQASGARIAVESATLALGAASLAGTVDGSGAVSVARQLDLAAGVALAMASLDLAPGAVATLGGDLAYAGRLTARGATLDLGGNRLALAGAAALAGAVAGAGTLHLDGPAELGSLAFTGGATLEAAGTVAQDGYLAFAGGALRIADTATYDLHGTIGGAVLNAGWLRGSGSLAALTSTGQLDLDGVLAIGGPGSLGGRIAGGTLDLDAGATTLQPGLAFASALRVGAGATAAIGAGLTLATLLLEGGRLDPGGDTLAVSGSAALAGSAGAGTLALAGDAVIGGFASAGAIALSGAAIATGGITLDGALLLGAGATFDLTADDTVQAGGIANAGLLRRGGGPGGATLAGAFANIGTVEIGRGTLALAGAATLAGRLTGTGTLQLAGGASLAPDLALDTGGLAIAGAATLGSDRAYGGDFLLAPAASLDLGGHGVTLTGSARLGGTVGSAGTLLLARDGAVGGLAAAGRVTLAVSGSLAQDGDLTLGAAAADAATLAVRAGGTYDLTADVNIHSVGTAAIANAGLLSKSAGRGVSYLFGDIDSTGTIAVNTGTLSLRAGTANLGGTIAGAGELDLNSAGSYALRPDLALAVGTLGLYGGGRVQLGGGLAYAGSLTLGGGTTLALNNKIVTLAGAAHLNGRIQGAGTVALGGSAEAGGLTLAGGAVLADAGTVVQDGAVTLGSGVDSALLTVAAGGTWTILADAGIAMAGNALIGNAGLLAKTGAAGGSTIAPPVLNTGTVAITAGSLVFAGGLTNSGLASIQGGTLVAARSLVAEPGRSGTLAIGGGGAAWLEGAVAASQSVVFTGPGTLALAQAAACLGTLAGVRQGDVIDLPGLAWSSAVTAAVVGGALAVRNGGSLVANLTLSASDTADLFDVGPDAAGGTAISAHIPCFAAGTRLRTPAGECAVEALRVGDMVTTASGRARPVIWIGQRRIDLRRVPWPEKVQPVRIAAGAFGGGLPTRALRLSPDHAIAAEGALVPVCHLVNGVTVVREAAERVQYFHVELATHDVLLAEGLAVESYLDTGNRRQFGGGAAVALHPDFAAPEWAERQLDGPGVAALRERLFAELSARGWMLRDTPEPRVLAGGTEILPVLEEGWHRFALPCGGRVRLLSPAAAGTETDPCSADGRRLGVAVAAIRWAGTPIRLTDARLGPGFHARERAGRLAWRWTDGDATLDLSHGAGMLEVRLRAAARRWAPPSAIETRRHA